MYIIIFEKNFFHGTIWFYIYVFPIVVIPVIDFRFLKKLSIVIL